MLASARGHEGTVKLLLSMDCNVNIYTAKGWTALSYAVGYDHRNVVEALLQYGIDVNYFPDRNFGTMPLILASCEFSEFPVGNYFHKFKITN